MKAVMTMLYIMPYAFLCMIGACAVALAVVSVLWVITWIHVRRKK